MENENIEIILGETEIEETETETITTAETTYSCNCPNYTETIENGFIGLYCTILFSSFLICGVLIAQKILGVKL